MEIPPRPSFLLPSGDYSIDGPYSHGNLVHQLNKRRHITTETTIPLHTKIPISPFGNLPAIPFIKSELRISPIDDQRLQLPTLRLPTTSLNCLSAQTHKSAPTMITRTNSMTLPTWTLTSHHQQRLTPADGDVLSQSKVSVPLVFSAD